MTDPNPRIGVAPHGLDGTEIALTDNDWTSPAAGLITRIENQLASLESLQERIDADIIDARAEIERGTAQLDKPFPRAAALAQARAQLAGIERLIAEQAAPPTPEPEPPVAPDEPDTRTEAHSAAPPPTRPDWPRSGSPRHTPATSPRAPHKPRTQTDPAPLAGPVISAKASNAKSAPRGWLTEYQAGAEAAGREGRSGCGDQEPSGRARPRTKRHGVSASCRRRRDGGRRAGEQRAELWPQQRRTGSDRGGPPLSPSGGGGKAGLLRPSELSEDLRELLSYDGEALIHLRIEGADFRIELLDFRIERVNPPVQTSGSRP